MNRYYARLHFWLYLSSIACWCAASTTWIRTFLGYCAIFLYRSQHLVSYFPFIIVRENTCGLVSIHRRTHCLWKLISLVSDALFLSFNNDFLFYFCFLCFNQQTKSPWSLERPWQRLIFWVRRDHIRFRSLSPLFILYLRILDIEAADERWVFQ